MLLGQRTEMRGRRPDNEDNRIRVANVFNLPGNLGIIENLHFQSSQVR
jgi:hypothetical protein